MAFCMQIMQGHTAHFWQSQKLQICQVLNIRKYAESIREIGMISLADTGHREAYIKFIRACWQRTNKQPTNIDGQVACQLEKMEALQQAYETAAAAGRNMDGRRTGTGVVSMIRVAPSGLT